MQRQITTQINQSSSSQAESPHFIMLQKKCACGQHTVAGGECKDCHKKRLKLQHWRKDKEEPAFHSGTSALAGSAAGPLLQSHSGQDFSQMLLRTRQPIIQRQPQGEQSAASKPTAEAKPAAPETVPSSKPVAPELAPAEPVPESAGTSETAVSSLIVEDNTTELGDGQMRKSEFMAELRTAVCTAADAALAGTGRTSEGCPYLDYWFDFYEQRDTAHGERALQRYAPEAQNATSARAYIPFVAERVRQGVARWASTGEISGVPEGVPTSVPGEPPAANDQNSGGIQMKAREGEAKPADDPAAIRDQLGNGRSLDSGVRSRMESAFGTSFSRVRLHNDSNAAGLSSGQNARAFTVGEHVAFGAGEYQPGTMLGDALIAHELAHVVQQSGATESVANMEVGSSGYDALERDADETAVGAVTSLWGNSVQTLQEIQQQTIPSLRSGLRLQRCNNNQSQQQQPQPQQSQQLPTVVVGNFRNSGSTADSGENNCANCPRALGIHTTDFKNGMELRGDITGHIPQAQYDFKRTREGGIWKKVGGSWVQRFHDGPGQNDDSTDADEDLTPENNHIYVEDIPGLGSDPSGGDSSATEAVLKGSFIEWVNVRVGTGPWTKRSNEFEWHSVSWVEKVGGSWRRKAGANEIETGSTTVGTGDP